jgi:biotin carboxylase
VTKTVMILAASLYQVEAIRAAKRLGYRVVTSDNRPDNPGHALADISYAIDTTDRHEILRAARQENICAILSPCTDVAVSTAAFVSQELGLRGVPLSAADTLTTKLRFREHAIKIGIPYPRFIPSDQWRQPISVLQFPVIVKPNKSSGSKGIRIALNHSEIDHAITDAKKQSLDGNAIIEQVIVGSQHTCEGLLRNGRVVFSVITDRFTTPPPYVATSGHRVPSLTTDKFKQHIVETIQKTLTSLDVFDCVFDCDFILTPDSSVVLLEITPRLGGNSIGKLTYYCTGTNIYDIDIMQSCGTLHENPVDTIKNAWGLEILGLMNGGTVRYGASFIKDVLNKDNIVEFNLDYSNGQRVKPFTNGRNRIGEVILTSRSRQELDKAVESLINKFYSRHPVC